jgi:hypothetical protein
MNGQKSSAHSRGVKIEVRSHPTNSVTQVIRLILPNNVFFVLFPFGFGDSSRAGLDRVQEFELQVACRGHHGRDEHNLRRR